MGATGVNSSEIRGFQGEFIGRVIVQQGLGDSCFLVDLEAGRHFKGTLYHKL